MLRDSTQLQRLSPIRILGIGGLCIGSLCMRGAPGATQSPEPESTGYTLFAPLMSWTTFLIDMQGEIVHRWSGRSTPGHMVYLLEDGNLLRTGRHPSDSLFRGGGQGGRIERIAPDGRVLWDYVYSDESHLQHHDVAPLPNGNVLILAWERKTRRDELRAGRNPQRLSRDGFWPDEIIEVEPVGEDGGRVVWEWHAWDHLIQDRDSREENYGDVAAHPELIDVNGEWIDTRAWNVVREDDRRLAALGYGGGGDEEDEDEEEARWGPGWGDWMHSNSIDYNAELDQIVLSVRNFSELWIIDHSTTTEQAAGHRGGRQNKGGDLLYRWGNPETYRAGDDGDQLLFGQHDVSWIASDCPGAGNLLVFNNGKGRPGVEFSSVEEIRPPIDEAGGYARSTGQAFGPATALWSYADPNATSFYSGNISGAQRLPNGNTLVCDGERGHLFEVDPQGARVWEYPVERALKGRDGGEPTKPRSGLFRATRLAPDHPGVVALFEALARDGSAGPSAPVRAR